jgi:hypothetical protein
MGIFPVNSNQNLPREGSDLLRCTRVLSYKENNWIPKHF